MKIQIQGETFYPAVGGIENYIYNVVKTLSDLDHEPTVLASQHLPNLPEKESFDGVNIIRHPYYKLPAIPFAPLNPIYYVLKLSRLIKNQYSQYDAIWSRYFYEACASGMAINKDLPLIFIQAAVAPTLNRIAFSNRSVMEKAYARGLYMQHYLIEKKAIDLSDKVVVLSRSRLIEICNFYNFKDQKFQVIPPGVDLSRFMPRDRDRMLMKELNIPEESIIILTIGRLSAEKNIGMLIRAFKKIKNKSTFLVIVGDGPERTRLEILAKKLSLENRTRFVGLRRDTERFYSIANLFVLTSIYEGFGQVFLEAMASGLPCIGLKQDYPKVIVASEEIIMEGQTGYCVDPYSIEGLADSIDKIIRDAELRTRLCKTSRRVCIENYAWEKCVNSLLKLSCQR